MLLSIFSLWFHLFPFQSLPDIIPFGTVRYEENLFMDTRAITNFNYRMFLGFVKRDSSKAFYKTMIPDTSYTIDGKNYFKHTDFRHKPVLGVTQKQAATYATWRGNYITLNISNAHNFLLIDEEQKRLASEMKGYKMIFRLPTPEELKTVSGKLRKVKPVRNFEEMTSEGNIVVTEAFTKKATTKKVTEPIDLNRTFRCVAYFEKR